MKRLMALIALGAGAAYGEMNNLDIFRMTRDKVPMEQIVGEVKRCGDTCDFVLCPSNVEMLTREGVQPEVIQAMKEVKPGPSTAILQAQAAKKPKGDHHVLKNVLKGVATAAVVTAIIAAEVYAERLEQQERQNYCFGFAMRYIPAVQDNAYLYCMGYLR